MSNPNSDIEIDCKMDLLSQLGDGSFFDDDILSLYKDDRILQILETIPDDPVSVVDSSGRTLLHYAAKYGLQHVVRYLINLGAEVNARDHKGKTPLMLVEKYHHSILDILFELNANMYLCDEDGKNVLQLFDGRAQFERLLNRLSVECAGDIEKIAKILIDSKCSLYSVLLCDNLQLFRIMSQNGCPIVPPDSDLIPADALYIAILRNNLDAVRIVLDAGVNVNSRDYENRKAISNYANVSWYGNSQNVGILELLLERGARLTDFDENGRMLTAFMLLRCSDQSIRVILKHTVDFNFRDRFGCNILHYLVSNENFISFECLDGKNIDVNARNYRGKTPLHNVCDFRLPAMKFLLDNGANVNSEDNDGRTFLMKILKTSLEIGSDAYCINRFEKSRQAIEYLLLRGADVQAFHSIFSKEITQSYRWSWMKSILAHLALSEARGTPINEFIRDKIDEYKVWRQYFHTCKKELERLKHIKVSKTLYVYDLLIANEAQIERYIRNEKLLLNLRRLRNKNISMPYYCYFLRNIILKSFKLLRMRKASTALVCEIAAWNNNSYDLVLDKIVGYLNENDLKNIFVRKK